MALIKCYLWIEAKAPDHLVWYPPIHDYMVKKHIGCLLADAPNARSELSTAQHSKQTILRLLVKLTQVLLNLSGCT